MVVERRAVVIIVMVVVIVIIIIEQARKARHRQVEDLLDERGRLGHLLEGTEASPGRVTTRRKGLHDRRGHRKGQQASRGQKSRAMARSTNGRRHLAEGRPAASSGQENRAMSRRRLDHGSRIIITITIIIIAAAAGGAGAAAGARRDTAVPGRTMARRRRRSHGTRAAPPSQS